jgi:CRISPR/Cas system CSM-associated protein Csm4 (group 5 of RAMP superfamily)
MKRQREEKKENVKIKKRKFFDKDELDNFENEIEEIMETKINVHQTEKVTIDENFEQLKDLIFREFKHEAQLYGSWKADLAVHKMHDIDICTTKPSIYFSRYCGF